MINRYKTNLHYCGKLNESLGHKRLVQNDSHHIIFSHFHDDYYRQYVYSMTIMLHVINYTPNISVVDEYVLHRHVCSKEEKKEFRI